MAFGDFAAGVVELGFYFIGEFELVFEEIVNPSADSFHLGAR